MTPPGRMARIAAASSSRCSRVRAGRSLGRPPPPRLRTAAQRPEPGARRVHEHPVEGALRQLRLEADVAAVGTHDGDRQARAGGADQIGPVRRHLDRGHGGTALSGEGAEQTGLAARAGAQIQPALVGAVQRRVRERRRDQLRTLVLDVCCPAADRRAGHRASRRRDRRRTARRRRAPRRPASASSIGSIRPGRAHRCTCGRSLSSVERRLGLIQVSTERLGECPDNPLWMVAGRPRDIRPGRSPHRAPPLAATHPGPAG